MQVQVLFPTLYALVAKWIKAGACKAPMRGFESLRVLYLTMFSRKDSTRVDFCYIWLARISCQDINKNHQVDVFAENCYIWYTGKPVRFPRRLTVRMRFLCSSG